MSCGFAFEIAYNAGFASSGVEESSYVIGGCVEEGVVVALFDQQEIVAVLSLEGFVS